METSPMKDSKVENPDIKPDTSNLSRLAADAREKESGSGGFMQAGTKVKNPGGRPKKPRDAQGNIIKDGNPQKTPFSNGANPQGQPAQPGVPVPPQFVIPTAKIVRPVVLMVSKIAENAVGHPVAKMTSEEFEEISVSFGLVLDKWMPHVSSQYGVELYFLMSIGTYGGRLLALRAELRRIAEEQADHAKRARGEKPREDIHTSIVDQIMPDEVPIAHETAERTVENVSPIRRSPEFGPEPSLNR